APPAERAHRYGVVPIYGVGGIASWNSAEPAAQTPDGHAEPAGPDRVDEETGSGGAPHPVRAPVLLRPVRIRTGDADADVELELDPAVELNPVLVRDLQDRGVGIDPGGLAAATVTPHGFAPQAALDAIAGM